MNILNWQNNQKLFLIEKDRSFTYADLFTAISRELPVLPAQSNIWFKASHFFDSYARLIALFLKGNRIFLVSNEQYSDTSYLHWVEAETLMPLKVIGENQALGGDSKKVPIEHFDLSRSYFVIRTSGSSGKKYKLVEHNTKKFFAKYERRDRHFERTLAFSPAETIAGMETLLEVLTLEQTLVSLGGELAPKIVVDALVAHGVDYFQTTPTYMNLLMVSSELIRLKKSHLKKIAFGSEPSQQKVLNQFRAILPQVELIHTYGMSEIGILETITSGRDACFFKLVPEVNAALIKQGALWVQSPSKMVRYLNAQETSNEIGPEWFFTGDMVEEHEGFIRVLGRADDLINIAGRKFYPSTLEEKLRQINSIKDVTIISEPNDFLGVVLIAKVTLFENVEEEIFRKEFKKFCDDHLERHMHPHKILVNKHLELTPRLKKMRKL